MEFIKNKEGIWPDPEWIRNLKLRNFLALIEGHNQFVAIELCDSFGYISNRFREKNQWKGNQYYKVNDNYTNGLLLNNIETEHIIPDVFLDQLGIKSWRPLKQDDGLCLFINVYELV